MAETQKTAKDETQDRGGFTLESLLDLANLRALIWVILEMDDPGCSRYVLGTCLDTQPRLPMKVAADTIPCGRCAVVLASKLLRRFRT